MTKKKTIRKKSFNPTKKVFKNLGLIEELGFMERYAMFMGKVQILEFGLKRLLTDYKKYEYEKLEKNTLGQVIRKLKKNHLREDYLYLLEDLLEYRNYFAHDFLADNALANMFLGGEGSFTKPPRQLWHALFSVEQAILVFDFIKTNGSFWKEESKPQKK